MSGEPVQRRSEGSRSGHRFATYSAVRHTSYLLVASLPIFIHGDPLETGKKLGRVETSVIVTGNAPARGGGGGGVLPYMGYIGMCRCEGYGFQAVYG